MVLPYRNPLGYKNLRTWQQANEILELTEKFVTTLPKNHPKTNQAMADVADHMLRSVRSVVRNIEEGFKRTTTKEYISFLGFSAGSLEELLADFEYCVKGGLGDAAMGNKGVWLCRGEAKMLFNQIKSLEKKIFDEKTVSSNELARDSINRAREREDKIDRWLEEIKNSKKIIDPPKFD